MKTWLKILGWVIGIGDFIFGIYLGNEMGGYDFNWTYALGLWVVGILTITACFYLIGIIERQEEIRDTLVYIATNEKDVEGISKDDLKTIEKRLKQISSKVQLDID